MALEDIEMYWFFEVPVRRISEDEYTNLSKKFKYKIEIRRKDDIVEVCTDKIKIEGSFVVFEPKLIYDDYYRYYYKVEGSKTIIMPSHQVLIIIDPEIEIDLIEEFKSEINARISQILA